VCDWLETYCVHGPGELPRHTPFRLHLDLRLAVWRMFELDEDRISKTWRRRWSETVIALPKGAAKSELGGALCLAEGLGPVRFGGWDADGDPVGIPVPSADVLILATSLEQADRTCFANVAFMADPANCAEALLEDYGACDVGRSWESSTRVVFPGGRGQVHAESAADAKSEGGKETLICFEESHEWISERLQSLYRRVSRNLAKRPDTMGLHLTNWFDPEEDSILKATIEAIEAGALPRTLLVANRLPTRLRIPPDVELRDCSDARLVTALRAVFGSADFVTWSAIIEKIRDPRQPDHESRRYYLNETARAKREKSWLPSGSWDACRSDLDLADGQKIWVGIDASLRRDSTAVAWCGRVDDRLVVRARVWTAVAGQRIPKDEVMQHIRDLAKRYVIETAAFDPRFFEVAADDLTDEGYPMIEVPQSIDRMTPVCGEGLDLIVGQVVAHDGDDELREHVLNAQRKFNERGFTLSKLKAGGKIDACIAMLLALAEAAGENTAEDLVPGVL
jgi:phage terminase large subunit-like protein